MRRRGLAPFWVQETRSNSTTRADRGNGNHPYCSVSHDSAFPMCFRHNWCRDQVGLSSLHTLRATS